MLNTTAACYIIPVELNTNMNVVSQMWYFHHIAIWGHRFWNLFPYKNYWTMWPRKDTHTQMLQHTHTHTHIPFPWVRLRRVSHKWSLGTGKTNIRSEGRHQTGQNPDQKLKSTIENDCEVAAYKLCFYTHFYIKIILMKMKYVQLQYLSIKNLIEWHHLVKSARYDIWPG